MWFGKNDDFVIHSFSKCYLMPGVSQVLSLKLRIYHWSGLWRMHIISIGRDWNGERFWREKNAWNKGVDVGKRMAPLGCSFLFEGSECVVSFAKNCSPCFPLPLSSTPLSYKLVFVLCVVSYFNVSSSGKPSQRTFSYLCAPIFWLSCYTVSFVRYHVCFSYCYVLNAEHSAWLTVGPQ